MPPEYITIDTINNDGASLITDLNRGEHDKLLSYYIHLRRDQIRTNGKFRPSGNKRYNRIETERGITNQMIERGYETKLRVRRDENSVIKSPPHHKMYDHEHGESDETKRTYKHSGVYNEGNASPLKKETDRMGNSYKSHISKLPNQYNKSPRCCCSSILSHSLLRE